MEEKLYTLEDLIKAYTFEYLDRDCKLDIFNSEDPESYITNRIIEE